MSHERAAILFKLFSLALVVVGCSAGEPLGTEPGESTVDQSTSDLSLRRLCAGPTGLECKANQYCAAAKVGHCPSRATYGVCAPRPAVCPYVYLPVCGCDGVTYSNACLAAAAGAAIAATGECKPKPTFCGGIAGFPCPEGQTCIDDPSDDCDPNNGGADCGGICVTRINPCAAVLCKVGTECIDKDGVAVCVPIPSDPCATVRCMAGTTCVNQGGVAVCLPNEPCGETTCSAGFVCCNPLRSICTKPGRVCIF